MTWQNPTELFSVTAPGYSEEYLGIAYDPKNNSLWVSGWDPLTTINDYSLTGALLSSFSTGHDRNAALGYDPADNTLWLTNDASNLLEQYSTTGTLLQRGTPTGLPSSNSYFSGDFSITAPSAVPEPASILLLATIVAGIGLSIRCKGRRKGVL